MDLTMLDDGIAIIMWIVGAGLMFTKKYYKIGYFFAFMPILFILISIAFYWFIVLKKILVLKDFFFYLIISSLPFNRLYSTTATPAPNKPWAIFAGKFTRAAFAPYINISAP